MKSRHLLTTPTVVVTNYKIESHPEGKHLHSFTPASTNTKYQFIANGEAVLKEGERYNFAYRVENGVNWVDPSAIAEAESVDPESSFYVARIHGQEIRDIELRKSNERTTHSAKDGTYLGRKYAWRIYGMAVPREVFELYLDTIKHPITSCITGASQSIAYKEEGLQEAMQTLLSSLERVDSKKNNFKSVLIPQRNWFQVKGISAITDKK